MIMCKSFKNTPGLIATIVAFLLLSAAVAQAQPAPGIDGIDRSGAPDKNRYRSAQSSTFPPGGLPDDGPPIFKPPGDKTINNTRIFAPGPRADGGDALAIGEGGDGVGIGKGGHGYGGTGKGGHGYGGKGGDGGKGGAGGKAYVGDQTIGDTTNTVGDSRSTIGDTSNSVGDSTSDASNSGVNNNTMVEGDTFNHRYPASSSFAPQAYGPGRCGAVLGLAFGNQDNTGAAGLPIPRWMSRQIRDCETLMIANALSQNGMKGASVEMLCGMRAAQERYAYTPSGGKLPRGKRMSACVQGMRAAMHADSERQGLRDQVDALQDRLAMERNDTQLLEHDHDELIKRLQELERYKHAPGNPQAYSEHERKHHQ